MDKIIGKFGNIFRLSNKLSSSMLEFSLFCCKGKHTAGPRSSPDQVVGGFNQAYSTYRTALVAEVVRTTAHWLTTRERINQPNDVQTLTFLSEMIDKYM